VVMGEASKSLEDKVNEMRFEMAENKVQMVYLQEQLALTEKKLMMNNNHVRIQDLEKVLLNYNKRLQTFQEALQTKDTTIMKLEKEISYLKESPWIYACAAQAYISTVAQTITYNNLISASTNIGGPGLDVSTGVFTSGYPGDYTAAWSLRSDNDYHNDAVSIYLRKNGMSIAESYHWSQYGDSSGGFVGDQGGRTLVLHLDRGDTLELYCQNCEAGISYTTFCVSLTHADPEL